MIAQRATAVAAVDPRRPEMIRADVSREDTEAASV
jgi:hypothetical protein